MIQGATEMTRGSWLIGILYAGTLMAAEPTIDLASKVFVACRRSSLQDRAVP